MFFLGLVKLLVTVGAGKDTGVGREGGWLFLPGMLKLTPELLWNDGLKARVVCFASGGAA